MGLKHAPFRLGNEFGESEGEGFEARKFVNLSFSQSTLRTSSIMPSPPEAFGRQALVRHRPTVLGGSTSTLVLNTLRDLSKYNEIF